MYRLYPIWIIYLYIFYFLSHLSSLLLFNMSLIWPKQFNSRKYIKSLIKFNLLFTKCINILCLFWKYRNKLIWILTQVKVKNNEMLFNSRNWVTISPLISNSVRFKIDQAITIDGPIDHFERVRNSKREMKVNWCNVRWPWNIISIPVSDMKKIARKKLHWINANRWRIDTCSPRYLVSPHWCFAGHRAGICPRWICARIVPDLDGYD